MQNKVRRVRPVRWCYDDELASRNKKGDLLMLATGMFPYLLHKGMIDLGADGISLTDESGNIRESIILGEVETVFLGYDALYPRRLSKNFGALWSPLRLTLHNGRQIYLIVFDRLGVFVRNKVWFQALKEILSA